MKPYFDNEYKIGRSNARLIGQAWWCGKCHEKLYTGIGNITHCPKCRTEITDRQEALSKAQDRFGKWVTL